MSNFRLATRDDNAALLELFGAVPMEGELVLSTRRAPGFFALYDMQRADAECWVYDAPRGLAGMGTVLVRSGWLDGRVQPVGYLGDLRSRAGASRARALVRFYGPTLDEVARRTGCEVFLTAVLASNQAALNALTRRRAGRAGQPHYQLLRRFDALSVQFTRRVRPPPEREVRVATEADLPALVAFLDADHRRRPFGFRFDDGELQHRLAHWPGFTLSQTYLAFDRGELAGCATAWDPSPVKGYRVMAYRGGMRWVKGGFNAAATLLRWPRLPEPGSEFRYFYLSNVSVRGDDPGLFNALLRRIYVDFHARGYHFFTFYREEGDPLGRALRGFITRALPFHLYAVTRAEVARSEFPPGRTGFEICLA